MTRARPVFASAFALAALLACGSGYTKLDEYPCPPGGTTLTYENFGRAFFANNCQVCHGQTSSARNGAPSEVDFGSLDSIHGLKDRIFARAALDNTSMPPGPDDPPAEERHELADWLACGAP